jgi:hypothetical protein
MPALCASVGSSDPALAVEQQQEAQVPVSKDVSTSEVWELDFCSRPLLDERGKKVWELLICDAERSFEYAEYFPNSKINSGEVRLLQRRLQTLMAPLRPAPMHGADARLACHAARCT